MVLKLIAGTRLFSVPVREGDTVAQSIWLAGDVPPPALCSGLGRCGACRVLFEEAGDGNTAPPPVDIERRVLGEVALKQGWRLACRHLAQDGMSVRLPESGAQLAVSSEKFSSPKMFSDNSARPLWVGVDVGTTSIHWRAVDHAGEAVASGNALNPQMGAGSDVVSRLGMAATPEGRRRLAERVQRFVLQLFAGFPGNVVAGCVAGNTAMTAIFLNVDCRGLLAVPYSLPDAGGRTVHLEEFPPLWIPPQLAPFVGGDVAAGMALLLSQDTPFPFLLADLGTNGEFVLALNEQESWITSVPMGPALEGIGLTHGGVAGPGSITSFGLTPAGLQAQLWPSPDGFSAYTISGTGYLSLLDILVRNAVLTAEGTLSTTGATPMATRLLASVVREAGSSWRLPLPFGLYLTPHDVEEVLKVKAAFSLAVERLLMAAGLTFAGLSRVALAGALGEHAPRAALEGLGFVSAGLGPVVQVVGNTSLEGAVLLAQHTALQERIVRWSQGCRVLSLTEDPGFMGWYMRHMRWGQVAPV